MKKYFFILIALTFLTSCENNDSVVIYNSIEPTEISTTEISTSESCTEGDVILENYGDPGRRLKNCFVQYPGEPSRDDGYYHVVEDICGQFTKEFMQNFVDSPITKIGSQDNTITHNCSYYFSDNDYVILALNYLSSENQKKGHELLEREVIKDPNIKMDNFVVYQKDGLINSIYLIFYENKYISINRSSANYLDNEKFLQMTIKLSEQIKDYK